MKTLKLSASKFTSRSLGFLPSLLSKWKRWGFPFKALALQQRFLPLSGMACPSPLQVLCIFTDTILCTVCFMSLSFENTKQTLLTQYSLQPLSCHCPFLPSRNHLRVPTAALSICSPPVHSSVQRRFASGSRTLDTGFPKVTHTFSCSPNRSISLTVWLGCLCIETSTSLSCHGHTLSQCSSSHVTVITCHSSPISKILVFSSSHHRLSVLRPQSLCFPSCKAGTIMITLSPAPGLASSAKEASGCPLQSRSSLLRKSLCSVVCSFWNSSFLNKDSHTCILH